MSRSHDHAQDEPTRIRRPAPRRDEALDSGSDASLRPQTGQAPDATAQVQDLLHSTFGNAIVRSALQGADIDGLGQVIAGELAASLAGMAAVGADGAGLEAAGNQALLKAARQSKAAQRGTDQALAALRGGSGGQQLPTGVRQQMERAFGRDFGHVRVHTDTAEQAEALGAEAVAMGSHLHFADGAYDPGSASGRAVIAHELTHVIQADEGRLPGRGGVSDTSMATEREAYANEQLASVSGLDAGPSPDVLSASSVDATIAPEAHASFLDAGLPSLGIGAFGGGLGGFASATATLDAGPATGAAAMAPVMGAAGGGGPAAASTSAPAMLRESDAIDKEETDTEASARHEVAMGLEGGFRRAIDMSQSALAVNVPKEGTGRRDGVFTGPAKSGHLAVDEYNDMLRAIGPDGEVKASAADDNLIDSAQHTQQENDGHVHLDGDPKLGATPETTATPPGGDPVMGGSAPDMVSASDRAGMQNSLGAEDRAGQSQSDDEGVTGNALLDLAVAEAFGKDPSGVAVHHGNDRALGEINARGATQNNAVHIRSDIDIGDLDDADAMETLGHEMAHALAGGGSGASQIDQPGDKGEQVAERSGERFAEWVTGGMQGPVPNLAIAHGGGAKLHRQTDEDEEEEREDPSPSASIAGGGVRVEDGQGSSMTVTPDSVTSATQQRDAEGNVTGGTSVTLGEDRLGLQVTDGDPDGQHTTAGVTFTDQGFNANLGGQGEDGINRSGSFGYEQDEAGTHDISIGGSRGPLSAGLGLQINAGTVTEGTAQGSSDVMRELHGDDAYAISQRTDAFGIDATLGFRMIEARGGYNSTSQLGVTQALPDGWDDMSADEQAAFHAQQTAVLDGVDGFADVDLGGLGDGQGIQFATANGWNAGGTIGIGAVSVGADVGGTTAHEVGIVRQGDSLVVSMEDTRGVSNSAALGFGGVELGMGTEVENSEQFTFEVDVNDPEAMAAMAEFQQTGLLPGADRMQVEGAEDLQTSYREGVAEVEALTAQVDAVLASGDPPMPGTPEHDALLASLDQIDSLQSTLDGDRNALNDMWREQMAGGNSPVSGISFRQTRQEEQETLTASLGPAAAEIVTRLGVEGRNVDGEFVQEFYYDREASFLGRQLQDYSVSAYDGGEYALSSTSTGDVGRDEAALLQYIAERDGIPLEALQQGGTDLEGTFHLDITQEQMDAYSAVMTDTSNEAVADMWSTFGDRAGAFWQPGDMEGPGARWYGDDHPVAEQGMDHHMLMARDQMVHNALSEHGYEDPDLRVGVDISHEDMATVMGAVDSPEAFQALPPTLQQTYIDTLIQTSGVEGDPFQVLSVISLIDDPEVRAQEMRRLMISVEEQHYLGSGLNPNLTYADPTAEFGRHIDSLGAVDPDLRETMQGAMRFELGGDVAVLAQEDAATLGDALGDSSERHGVLWLSTRRDAAESRNILLAAQQQGPDGVDEVFQASGLDPVQFIGELGHDPVNQAWALQMLMGSGQADALRANQDALLSGLSGEQRARFEQLLAGGNS